MSPGSYRMGVVVHEQLLPYVKDDPTAFYNTSEFTEAVQSLKNTSILRAESVDRQLKGELSCITDKQDLSARVDASDLTIFTGLGILERAE